MLHATKRFLNWAGFGLSLLGALSYFLLSTEVAFAMAFLTGDPRRFGALLIGAGLFFALLNIGLRRA